MADKKISELTEFTVPVANDLFAIVDSAGSETKKLKFSSLRSAILPAGLILMWKGTIATIPAGWALCNGANGTPDLRDRFIVGAKQDDGGVAKTNVSGSLSQWGGFATHQHGYSGGSDYGYANMYEGTPSGSSLFDTNLDGTYEYAAGWEHVHNIYDMGHTHEVGGTTDVGGTLPPYFALAFIMKL